MKDLLKTLREQGEFLSKSFIAAEKAKGIGMLEVLDSIESFKKSDEFKKEMRIKRASEILVEEELSVEEMIDAIEKMSKISPEMFIEDIEGVYIWSSYEYRYNCNTFLEHINPDYYLD